MEIIEVMKLHFKNKQHSIIQFTMIFIAIVLLGVTIQLISWKTGHLDTNTIKIPMLYVGSWLGALGGLFVLTRGRNGEGKFLSRLPVSKHTVFIGKVLFLITVYIAITAALFSMAWLSAGFVKLLYPSLHLAKLPALHEIYRDALSFLRAMPPFLFLAALGLWLQKWLGSDTVRMLIILGILTIIIGIPSITAFFFPNHPLILKSSSIIAFFNRFQIFLSVGLELLLFFGAMALYRLRHFRNF